MNPEALTSLDQQIVGTVNKAEALLANLRPCNGCTLCCESPGIEESEMPDCDSAKPSGEMCKYCTGKGCSIYTERPVVCKEYACLYSVGLTEDFPKDTGVAWTFQPHNCPGGLIIVMGHCRDIEEALCNPTNIATLKRFLKETTIVTGAALRDGENAVSFIEEGEDALIIDIDPEDPARLEVLEDTEKIPSPLAA